MMTRDGGTHPVWSPDGKELIVMNDMSNGQLYSIAIRTQPSFTFGNPVPLSIKGFSQTVGSFRNYDITPDGKQFVVLLPAAPTSTESSASREIEVVLNWFEELKQRTSHP